MYVHNQCIIVAKSSIFAEKSLYNRWIIIVYAESSKNRHKIVINCRKIVENCLKIVKNRCKIVQNRCKIVENHYRIFVESIKKSLYNRWIIVVYAESSKTANLCRRCVVVRLCSEITPCKLSQRASSYKGTFKKIILLKKWVFKGI